MARQTRSRTDGLWASGGVLGAILASSCCIAPLLLVTLGIGGGWIGNLTALEPYKWWFIAASAVFIGLGFHHVYFRPAEPCGDGTYCARPEASLIVRSALWIGALLLTAAATIDCWAPLFY